MKIELQQNIWFKLPPLGRDAFTQLMRAGVKYETEKGFLITVNANISTVEATLSLALGKPVKVTISFQEPLCFICSNTVGCGGCSYRNICAKNGAYCLCEEHLSSLCFISYRLKFMDKLGKVIGKVAEKTEVEIKEGIQWSEKYRPTDLNFMVGNEDNRLNFMNWLFSWEKSKSALLLGPPGVGKTTLVQLAAKKMGLPLMQLNASDERSKSKLNTVLSDGILSRGLSGKGFLIFLDELDGIDGRADFGALDLIRDAISKSRNPMVLAANDEDNDIVRRLQGKMVEIFRFDRVMPRLIELFVSSVIEREDIKVEYERVKKIVIHSNGDIRAALNNLQINFDARYEIADRDEQMAIREAFTRIFTANNFDELYKALESIEISRPSDLLQIVFNNIVSNYTDDSQLVEALRKLSWLDNLAKKIEFEQRWELLRYFKRILAGIILEIKNQNWKYSDYDPAFFHNRFGIWNDGRIIRTVSERIAHELHISRHNSILLYPFIVLMAMKGLKAAMKLVCFNDSSGKLCNKEYEKLLTRLTKKSRVE